MRRVRLDSIVRWCRGWQALSTRRVKGQVALYMAVLLTSLMGLAGAGVDYGLIVIEGSRLQNSLDAASLAGARELVTSTETTQTLRNSAADTKATEFLTLHAYTVGTLGSEFTETTGSPPVTATCKTGTSSTAGTTFKFCRSASDGGAFNDTMKITGTLVKPTSFWKAIGINSTTLNQSATAVASGGMVDVMLSLDTSGSMERSGTADIPNLQNAVVAFIEQMQVNPANPRGTQVGIARFAGIKCRWDRGTTTSGTTHGNGNLYIDLDRGPNGSEYVTPCEDDVNIMIGLTMNKQALLKVARNDASPNGASTCPVGAVGYGCPIISPKYRNILVEYGTGAGTVVTAAGLRDNYTDTNDNNDSQKPAWTGDPADCDTSDDWCMATGTKIAAGLSGVTAAWNAPSGAWNATQTGTVPNGRTDPATTGVARKVLVLMTDGVNESSQLGIPTNYTPTLSNWDTTTRNAAAALKSAGVEIYTVGFYCKEGSSPSGWCASKLVYTDRATRPCLDGRPWPADTTATSNTDKLLRDISSSPTGSCDHYFPVRKTEDLPQLFRIVAGSIARGRLR